VPPPFIVVAEFAGGPARQNREAMEIFRSHSGNVVRLPAHQTHGLKPVDVCWAKQFMRRRRGAASLLREAGCRGSWCERVTGTYLQEAGKEHLRSIVCVLGSSLVNGEQAEW
jgi:hypothetical protein